VLFTWKRARLYGLLLCGLYVVAYVSVIVQGSPPLNSSHEPIGGDYIAFYAAGHLAFSGQLYDHATVSTLQSALLGNAIPAFYDAYRNPPFYALLFVPLAWLPLVPSFAVWSVLSLGLLALSLWLAVDLVPGLRKHWPEVAILTLAFGPVYFGLIDGENATVSLLLSVLIGRALLRDQPARAGPWAALGLFKPQLFFIWPIVFLAARRWRALAAYTATAAALLLLSLALVGPDGLQAWLRILLEMESGNATRNAWRMHSLKAFFDLLLPAMPVVAWCLYAIASACLLVLLAAVWRRRPGPKDLALPLAFTTLVAVLIDPHLVDYDLTILFPAALLAVPMLPRLRWLVLLLYPLLLFRAQLPLGDSALQLSVPALVLAAWLVCRPLGPVSLGLGRTRRAVQPIPRVRPAGETAPLA
jgi:alpha-1,2-mannosyltransferase